MWKDTPPAHTRSFILVDGQIIVVARNLVFRYKEALFGALTGGFSLPVMKASDNIGNVVFRGWTALVVQREAVGLHIIEPNVIGATVAGLGENQDGSRNTRIGLEHAGGHRNYGFQTVVLDDLPANRLMCSGRAEQNAIRDDAGTASADLQHPQEQSEEQQLGLLVLQSLSRSVETMS